MRVRIPAGLALAFLCAGARADFALNMQPGVTVTSRQVYDLHMLILWICTGIGALVFGVIAWVVVRHRQSRHVTPARFAHNLRLEVVWAVIPLLILAGMAIPATRTLILMEDTSAADLTIKVTGHQWRWQYEYLDEGVSFFSHLATDREAVAGRAPKGEHYLREVDEPLVLPVGKKIRFLLTSNDVIHSWWVPALGWKKDGIPGFINEAWARIDQPGIYRGHCAELCGRDHAFMPVVVEARPEDAFRAWLDERRQAALREAAAAEDTWELAALMERGREVYGRLCVACHQAEGQGLPGVFPALKGSPVTTGPVDPHLDVVLNGRPGTAMAAFGPQLSDAEIAAVVTYERNAFGGEETLLQPAEVKDARERLQAAR